MGSDEVRDAVLDSARAAFHTRGYVRTSMKGVAAAAGVAPDVVSRYWGSKEKLFAAAMTLPFDPATAVPQLLAPGLDGMGERLVRLTLDTLGDEESREDLIALFKAGASSAKAAAGIQSFFEQSVIDRLVRAIGVPDARLRVSLISSYLIGVAVNRFIIKQEPIASMPEDDLVRIVAPTIQNWLDPSVPLPGGAKSSSKSSGKSASRTASKSPSKSSAATSGKGSSTRSSGRSSGSSASRRSQESGSAGASS